MPKCVRLTLAAALAVSLAAGCHKETGVSGTGNVPTDPAVAANLARLSREVRKAMPHFQLTRNFDDFVAQTHVEVPPPPPGQKYAINEKWKVILIDAK